MVVGTLYINKQHAFVDTYLLSHWLIVFPCAGFSRKDAPLRPSVNDPITEVSRGYKAARARLEVGRFPSCLKQGFASPLSAK